MIKLFLPYVFLLSIIYSCNQDHVKDNNQSEILVEESVQNASPAPLQVQQATINKDQENDVWNGNVYRNFYYKFRVEFPKGWEYDKGSAKNTVARAVDRKIGATFSIVINHLGSSLDNPDDITKNITPEKLKEEMTKSFALQNIDAKNFKVENGYLNNFPAYLIKLNQLVRSGDREFIYLSKQVQCHVNYKVYVVSLNIPEEFYDDEMNKIYHRVIDSFKFEIAY